jgi:hypothetical protein
MSRKIANQQIVIRLDRADNDPPIIPENKVPLPLGIGQSINWHHCTEATAARVRQ